MSDKDECIRDLSKMLTDISIDGQSDLIKKRISWLVWRHKETIDSSYKELYDIMYK